MVGEGARLCLKPENKELGMAGLDLFTALS